jgi:hypothetical protein
MRRQFRRRTFSGLRNLHRNFHQQYLGMGIGIGLQFRFSNVPDAKSVSCRQFLAVLRHFAAQQKVR